MYVTERGYEDKPGIGAFGVIAIVAGVALAGFLVYKAVKK